MSKMQHVDFELELFLKELHHEVNALAYSDEDGASKEDKFTEYVMEVLSEAGETEGYRLCHYEKENKFENIQYKINGYAIEEGYETLDIFITDYRDTSEAWRQGKAEFDKLIKWSSGFVNVAIKGYHEEIEPSTEPYKLAQFAYSCHKDLVRVNIFLLSNGNIPHDPPKNFRLKNLEDLTITIHVWDAERLHRLSQSRNNRAPIEIDLEETLGQVIPCLAMPSSSDLYECYLAIVPGQLLSTLYRNYGTRLLESNVRAFLQQTGKVNKGIRDTIRKEPWMFLPYNNGLATTARSVNTRLGENGQLVITALSDFQIVNGGQTTASLFHTQKIYKADLSDVFVQMKLTVIKDEEKKDQTVPYISRYANSQNKVSELDLTSNNPFLQRLEELSRTTFAIDPTDSNKQSVWFFERVKGQYREALNKEPTKGKKDAFKLKYPRGQMIIKSQIARNMNIWKQLPHHVSKGGQKNYNFYLKECEKEFAKNPPGRVYWQDIVANSILYNTTDQLFGRKGKDPVGDTNIKSFTVVYTLALFHSVTDNRLNLGTIWEKQLVSDVLRTELKKGLEYVYHFLTHLDVALISEAAKAEKTWVKLKEQTDTPFKIEVIEPFLITDVEQKARYDSDEEDAEKTRYYDNNQRILSLGLKFWDGLGLLNIRENILSNRLQSFVFIIKNKLKEAGTLSAAEVEKGMEIIDFLIEHSFDFEAIKSLSKQEDIEIVDASKIYNRISRLSADEWKRVIDLGEQTGNFSFNEISVIKTVIKKLKDKEEIGLKRLTIVETALAKLKKFGIKY